MNDYSSKNVTMNKTILTLLILLFSTIGFAQGKTKKNNARKQAVKMSKQQINQMKNGALLVRLKTKKKSIEALRKSGRNSKADKLEKKQAKYNMGIVNGFKTDFDFCPTYFFYSDYSQAVYNKQFDNVEFLNDSLQYDSTITFNNTSFLTAEFGIIEQDTAHYFDEYYYVPGQKNGQEKRKSYNGATNMSFGALIIKSDQFIQLKKPFPYYSRTLYSIPIRRSPKLVIKTMNSKLQTFHGRVNN